MINNEEHNRGINTSIIVSLMVMLSIFVIIRILYDKFFSYWFTVLIAIGCGLVVFFIIRLARYIAKKDDYDEWIEQGSG